MKTSKSRYQLALLLGTLSQLLALSFLVLFYDLIFNTCEDISPTFAFASMFCQVIALLLFYIADYNKNEFKRSVPKPKRHYKEWSERTFNTIFIFCIFALYALFMIFICTH